MEHGGSEEQSRVMKLRQKLLREYSVAVGGAEASNKNTNKGKSPKNPRKSVFQ